MPTIISIESDENYYNTAYQAAKRNDARFIDNSKPSLSLDKTKSFGLFQLKSSYDNSVVENSSVYPVAKIVIDESGSERKILSPSIDTFASSSVDVYKNGVEITQNKHWTSGLAKITAGTAGHLYDRACYGFNELDIISSDRYVEIDVFDPIDFVTKTSYEFIYPIVTSDVNQLENYNLNGIIEPFPIRPVISNFSINFPFEPHSTKGQFGIGNINWRGATDSVESVSTYDPIKVNSAFFLDSSDIKKISTGVSEGTVSVGPPDGYFNIDENHVSSFEDRIDPRNERTKSTYSDLFNEAVMRMTGSSIKDESYINAKEKSATNGSDCEYIDLGVDSLTYRNLIWNTKNRDNRRYRRDILNLRDSERFIKDSTNFNDTSTIFYVSGRQLTVEYPAMLPLELTASLGIDQTTRTELFKSGSITVKREVRSFVYEQPLSDSRLSSKRRLGTL